MQCPKCGKEITKTDTACPECGYGFLKKTIKTPQEAQGNQGDDKTVMFETLKETWKFLSGSEEINATIKGQVKEASAPSNVNIRMQNIAKSDASSTAVTPDYEILEKLGEGGMGVIYTARQASVDRTIALKMIKGDETKNDKDFFLSEAVATGNLDHPNIVPIYDLGSNNEGQLFYSMKMIKGKTWSDEIRDKSEGENIEILMRVCDAIAFAHSRGIIHRDLKPENTMLGEFGEVLVMDWGLALAVMEGGKAQRLDAKRAAGGTPTYMAPEMGEGDSDAIGFASDIYLLGAILFEIVTGMPPHTGSGVMQCLYNVMQNIIQKTDKQGELIDIAYKAMAADPADRYGSVKEFQEVLRDYSSHAESNKLANIASRKLLDVRNKDKENTYQAIPDIISGYKQALELWGENKKAIIGLWKARELYVSIAIERDELILAETQLEEMHRARDKYSVAGKKVKKPEDLTNALKGAQVEKRKKERTMKLTRWGAIAAGITIVLVSIIGFLATKVQKDRAERAEEDLREENIKVVAARDLAQEQKAKAEEARKTAEAEKLKVEEKKKEISKLLEDVKTERDNATKQKEIAEKALGEIYENEYYNSIELASKQIEGFNLRHGRNILWSIPAAVRGIGWRYLANQAYPALLTLKGHEGSILATGYAADNRVIISAGHDEKIVVWDAVKGTVKKELPGYSEYNGDSAISPNSQVMAVITYKKIELYDAFTGTKTKTIEIPKIRFSVIAFSPDSKHLACGGREGIIRIFSIKDSSVVKEVNPGVENIYELEYFPDGLKIFICHKPLDRMYFHGYDLSANTAFFKIKSYLIGGISGLNIASISPSGGYVLVGSKRSSGIEILGVRSNRRLGMIKSNPRINGAVFSKRTSHFAVASEDKTVKIWRASSREPYAVFPSDTPASSVDFSSDNRTLVSGHRDGSIKIWGLIDPLHGGFPYKYQGGYECSDLYGESHQLLVHYFPRFDHSLPKEKRENNKKIYASIWDIKSRKKIVSGPEFESRYTSITGCFSPDGKLCASAGDKITIWDSKTGKTITELEPEGRSFRIWCFSPDNTMLAFYSMKLRIWDITRKVEIRNSDINPRSCVFSPDSTQLLVTYLNDSGKLWNLKDNKIIHDFGKNPISGTAVFTPDGSKIIVTGAGKIHIWDAEKLKKLHTLPGHTRRVKKIRIHPDSKLIITTGEDSTVRIWDIEKYRELCVLKCKDRYAFDAVILPDLSGVVTRTITKLKYWKLLPADITLEKLHQTKLKEYSAYLTREFKTPDPVVLKPVQPSDVKPRPSVPPPFIKKKEVAIDSEPELKNLMDQAVKYYKRHDYDKTMIALCAIARIGNQDEKEDYMRLLSKYCLDKTELNLPDLASKSRKACRNCNGDYRRVCIACNGTRKRRVRGVMGEGEKVCGTCKGEGVIICPECKERRELYVYKECVSILIRRCI
ncbi:protein kinase [Planctomycetota bacterium]